MNIDILLDITDIDRIGKYLNFGTEDIDDILMEITTQADKVISEPYTASSIQRKAIQEILIKQDLEYIRLIRDALGPENVTHMNQLSYKEAAAIIRHVNSKVTKI